MSVSAVSDPVARRRQLAAWYLLCGHRVVWMLPLTAALAIFVLTTILRGSAADPHANLKESRKAFLALAPEAVPDAENAAKAYERAFKAFVPDIPPGTSGNTHHYIGLPCPHPKEVIAHLSANATTLDELAAAAKLPRCNFGSDYNQGAGMLLPYLAKMRACARLLALRARELAHAGEHQQAAALIVQMFSAAEAVTADGGLTNRLVAIAITGIAISTVQAIVRWDTPMTDTDLVAYMDALRNNDWRESLTASLQTEQKQFLFEFDRIMVKETASSLTGIDAQLTAISPLYGAERECFKATMDELIADSKTAPWLDFKKWTVDEEKAASQLIRKHQTVSSVLTHMILPTYGRIALSLTRAQNQIALARTALAFLRYRVRHGRDPQSISELVPDFLPAEPVDACMATPFKFRTDNDGEELRDPITGATTRVSDAVIRLYTFAENGVDDNGLNALWQEEKNPNAPKGSDDIFFRIPLAKAK